MNACKLTTTA